MARFCKCDRLRKKRDFDRVRRGGSRVATDAFVISIADAPGKRLGIVVGGNVGTAVVRNRLKRVVREYFRVCRDRFPWGDCVVIARPKAARLKNAEMREQLERALAKHQKQYVKR